MRNFPHRFDLGVVFDVLSEVLDSIKTRRIAISGGPRNFKTGGGGAVPARYNFRSAVCFDAPSYIPHLFVARVGNKINNVNIVY